MYNTGQSTVTIRDLKGVEYPAIAEVNRKRRVNGQRELSLSFLYTEINKDFMNELEFGWKILFGGEWYTITHPGYSTDGDYFAINVTAILSFFVDLNGYYLQDKVEEKSFTPAAFFADLFAGTPYNYVLVDNLSASTLSYEDNQSKTERFLYAIDRFKAEYIVRDKTVYIYNLIGNDKDIILHEDLNVQGVSIDVDASGFHTWAKGFGDLPENDEKGDYRLKVEYRSPLISKYGLIEGPAIKDGNYKYSDKLTEAVKNQVENSYVLSTTIEAVDLSNNGYPEMVLDEGDRVWLYVSKLNLNQQVRVVEIDENFDWEGNLIDVNYTVGNEGIAARYKTQQYDTLKDFKDILSGKKKIQVNWLPDAIKRASDIINGNLDSHFKYGAGEIIGINRNNPNGYMRFNTDGLGFSRDGGKTYRSAITYEGIVADAITAGTLRGVLIEGNDIIGNNIVGGDITGSVVNGSTINGGWIYNDGERGQVRINNGGITATDIRVFENGTFFSEGGYVTLRAGGTSASTSHVYLQAPGEVRATAPKAYTTYIDLRAKQIIAESSFLSKGNAYLANNDGVFGSNNGLVILRSFLNQAVYLQGEEIRATNANDAGSYVPVRASAFPTQSSARYKTNIQVFEDDVIEMLKGPDIYTYHLISDIYAGIYDKQKIGMIAEATLPIFRDEDGVDPYTITSFLFKVCQVQQEQIEGLQQRISDLEMVV